MGGVLASGPGKPVLTGPLCCAVVFPAVLEISSTPGVSMEMENKFPVFFVIDTVGCLHGD